MKLFDENFKYTQHASDLYNELSRIIAPIFKREFDKGASPRELSHIMSWVVNDIELDTIIGNDYERQQAAKKAETEKHSVQSAAASLRAVLKEKGFSFVTVGIYSYKDEPEKIIIYTRKDREIKKYITSCGNQFQTFKVEVKQIKEK